MQLRAVQVSSGPFSTDTCSTFAPPLSDKELPANGVHVFATTEASLAYTTDLAVRSGRPSACTDETGSAASSTNTCRPQEMTGSRRHTPQTADQSPWPTFWNPGQRRGQLRINPLRASPRQRKSRP